MKKSHNRVERDITVEDMVYALNTVTWYNGLAEYLLEWKTAKREENGWLLPPYFDQPEEEQAQLQVVWMICVSLFGDWGTSARTGWIPSDSIEYFCEFIDAITQIYRDSEEADEQAED